MGSQSNSSRTDTVVKLVLIFFIALLSFSVGTFVGKQVSDSDHRTALLEKDYQSFREVASVDKSHGKMETPESAISPEEVNNLTEEFVKAEKTHTNEDPGHTKTDHNDHSTHTVAKNESHTSDEHEKGGYKKFKGDEHGKADTHQPEHSDKEAHSKETQHQAPAKEHKTSASHSGSEKSVHPAAERVAQGQAPSPKVAKPRLPSSVLPSVATSAIGKYTVQVASYATEDEAKTHAANLKWQGYSAFYIPAEIKGKTWYRVSVGLFSNQKSAANFRTDFLKQSGVKSAIIQKIIK